MWFVLSLCLTQVVAQSPVADSVDAVVVCPKAWQGNLGPWLKHRAEQGVQVAVIDVDADATSLQNKIRQVAKSHPNRLRYLLLVGDVPSLAKRLPGAITIPTFQVPSTAMVRFGSEPLIASDNPYGDLDGDGLPELAVGRIPCDSQQDLDLWIQRVVAFERQVDYSQWRRRVHVVAGVGGFGMLIDSAVEMTAKQFISQGIPGGYSISLTQASPSSPYCPLPEAFAEATVSRFNEGGLFWIYLGHGNVRHLDFVKGERDWHCILDQQSLVKVRPGVKSPIAVFLACYTGAFDAKEDSLAEQLVLQQDGPVAALAGSRMTGPYGMSVLSSEMLEICFDQRCETLGEVVRLAKCRSMSEATVENGSGDQAANPKRKWIDQLANALSPSNHDLKQERFEHVQMMNLIGDPMLRICHPEKVELECEESIESGGLLKVRGYSALPGKITVDLIYRRDRIPEPARVAFAKLKKESVAADKTSGDSQSGVVDRNELYELANQSVICQETGNVQVGPFEVVLQVPSDIKGACAVRAFVESSDAWGLGSQDISVRSKRTVK